MPPDSSNAGEKRTPARSLLRRVALDFTPLRVSPAYRLIWLGQLVSVTGSQVRTVVVLYHVFVLTHSPLAVGLVGAFQAVPLIAFSLWGGVIADAMDRRKLLLFTQSGLILVMGSLAVGTFMGVATVWFIYVITGIAAVLFAVDAPARQSLIPTLVERRHIPAAMALGQVLFQTALTAGPAVGGVVIARFGIATGYLIDASTFAVALVATIFLKVPKSGRTKTSPGLRSLVEGLRYLRRDTILLSTMAVDFTAMLFGWPRAMFPFFAESVFKVGPEGLGLLFAAPGAGALIAALGSGWVVHVRRQGIAVIASVAVWGAAIAAFGLLRGSFVVGLFLLAVAGAADVVSAIVRGTIVQLSVPDQLRGRITAVNLMVVISGPRLGEVESGVVANFFTPRLAVVSGGVACLAALGIVAALVPKLIGFRVSPEEEPSAVAAEHD
jgi:MFS family permease